MKTIKLQGIGEHYAKRASEFKTGDTIVWNYGIKSFVTNVTKQSVHTLFEARNENGDVAVFRKNHNTLMGTEK